MWRFSVTACADRESTLFQSRSAARTTAPALANAIAEELKQADSETLDESAVEQTANLNVEESAARVKAKQFAADTGSGAQPVRSIPDDLSIPSFMDRTGKAEQQASRCGNE